MKFRKNNKGFTLLEIIIVVAIIAILAVILLPRLARVRQPANDAKRINDLRTIQGFLELYYQSYREYPDAAVVGYGAISDTVTCESNTLCGILTKDKITTSLPSDPVAGYTYSYSNDGTNQSYVLGATLQDSSNPALKTDVDGTPFTGGISCNDPIYCIQF